MKKYALAIIAILFSVSFGSQAIGERIVGGVSQKPDRRVSVNFTSDANITATQCADTLITNYGWNATKGDLTLDLPTAEAGLDFEFLNLVTDGSADIYFDTYVDTDQQVLDGTACGDGNMTWTENATAYESIRFYTFSVNATEYDWAAESKVGTWANAGKGS